MLTKTKKQTNKKHKKRERREREKTFLSASLVNEHTHTHPFLSLFLTHPHSLTHTHDSPVVTILSYNDDDDANLFASSSRLSFPPSHPSPTHCLTPFLPSSLHHQTTLSRYIIYQVAAPCTFFIRGSVQRLLWLRCLASGRAPVTQEPLP